MTGRLILCATPIGNLADAPPRLGEAIAAADIVYAEDTRRSRVLLEALGVERPLRSYFVGNEDARRGELAARLAGGDTVCLLTDAGTPSISDPGYSAVEAAIAVGAVVTIVPGPSAVTAALAVSGIPAERFVFEGFLPRKGGARTARIDELAAEERTIVIFTAKDRLAGDVADLAGALGGERPMAVVRELTKLHEEVWRGSLQEASDHWAGRAVRGELTVVIAGAPAVAVGIGEAVSEVEALIAGGASLGDAVRRVAADTGTRRRRLYEAALRSRPPTQSA